MKHRNLGKFLIAAASISMAVSPITALANEIAPVVLSEEEAQRDPKMLLKEAVKYAEAQSTDHVVPKVKANLKNKLDAAKIVQDNSVATAEDIKTAWSDLVDAVHYLSFTGDPTKLGEAVNAKANYKAEDYTEESYAAYAAAVTEGETLLANVNALQADLDAAEAKIKDAESKLVKNEIDPTPAVSKDALKAAIVDAKDKKEADYTADSWKTFADALKTAQDVDAKVDATQDEVDAAKDALVAAQTALKAKPATPAANKDKLKKAITLAGEKKEADYTADSWKPFADALKAAQDVDKKADATQAEVDNAEKDLTSAQAALKAKPATPAAADKKALKDEMGVYDTLTAKDKDGKKKNYYTPDTEKAYKAAYDAAKAVDAKADASQDEVDKAAKALADAKKALEQFMFRVYNPNNGEHLFTTDENEYNYLVSIGWSDEGKAWVAPAAGREMVRVYDKNSGEHHYTSDKNEIDFLTKNGWANEGIKWYSAEKDTGVVIHRVYNPNETRAGRHHYTLVNDEKDYLKSVGWNWENNESALIYANRTVKDSEK